MKYAHTWWLTGRMSSWIRGLDQHTPLTLPPEEPADRDADDAATEADAGDAAAGAAGAADEEAEAIDEASLLAVESSHVSVLKVQSGRSHSTTSMWQVASTRPAAANREIERAK